MGAAHNPFLPAFLGALEAAGCQVISIDRAEDLAHVDADIVLLHWAERAFGEARSRMGVARKIRALLAGARDAQRRGARVVWLVHNIAPHDARPLQRLIWPYLTRALARRADGFITLSPGTVDSVRRALPDLAAKPGVGLWHPAYTDAETPPDLRDAARAALGFGQARVLGYCGQIRPYKGVEELITTFRAAPAPDLRLWLAGRPGSAAFAAHLRHLASGDTRIRLDLRDLGADEFRTALGVCDVTVAPLRDYLHSGSIIHALSAGRAVLTPDTPFSRALKAELGGAWLQLYTGALTPELLDAATPAPGRPDLAPFAADTVGRAASAFFSSL